MFPEEPGIGYLSATALYQLKKFPEAVKAFERTEKLAQTRRPELLGQAFYFTHGVALERSGRFDEAALKFQKSIELASPDDPAR